MFNNVLTLNNGVKIPQLGLGTWFIYDDIVADAVKEAVNQLCIRYTLQLGAVSLPKTGNAEHMRTNAEVEFEISAEDMEIKNDTI